MLVPGSDLQNLFDSLPDVIFFLKDSEGRYTHVNSTLVHRLRLKRRDEAIGRTTRDLFPAPFGESYAAQDQRVLGGEVIDNHLEVVLLHNRASGWCRTCKQPLRDANGAICGVMGFSRDLASPDTRSAIYPHLRNVMEYMQRSLDAKVQIAQLAAIANLSVAQLGRYFQHVFQLSPHQMLIKLRIEKAMQLLHGDESVAAVASASGFSDQSAFTRQFKATVGLTPRAYRTNIVQVAAPYARES